MKSRTLLLLFTSLIVTFTGFSQAQQESQVASTSNLNDLPFFLEKLYLHIDRSYYKKDDDIRYKIYLLNAHTHKLGTESEVVYVDLIDPQNKIIDAKVIKVSSGVGNGNFKLPFDPIRGEYTIRAYTNYMRNFDASLFFRKKIYIQSNISNDVASKGALSKLRLKKDSLKNTSLELKPDLQFFPEGGYMVNNFINTIGFKILNPEAKSVEIVGQLKDDTGKVIKTFSTSKFGMGKFKFIPQTGVSYQATINYNGIDYDYNLPTALKQGVVLTVLEDTSFYKVGIQSSTSGGLNDFKFIGLQRKGIVLGSTLVGNKSEALISVPKDILEDGIVQFTLLDNSYTPICERLLFYESPNNNNNNKVSITSTIDSYGKRELVEFNIALDSSVIQKSKTEMSVSVAEISTTQPQDKALNIKSYLLLNSELKGTIENPGYYFNSNNLDRKKHLDLLMLTQGWRQYMLNGDTEEDKLTKSFLPETGFTIAGDVKSAFNQKKPAMAEMSLSYISKGNYAYGNVKTDSLGHFAFTNLNFTDSTSVVVQAKKIVTKKKNKRKESNVPSKNFIVKLGVVRPPKVIINRKFTTLPKTNVLNNYRTNLSNKPFIIDDKTTRLDTVTLIARKEKVITKKNIKRALYKNPNISLDFKEVIFAKDPVDALNSVGVFTNAKGEVNYRGRWITPVYLLNGDRVDRDAIIFTPVADVHFVDVLRGNSAAIYGRRYVIAVYTLDGSKPEERNDENVKSIMGFKHPGFYRAKKFYSPQYTSKKLENDDLDTRTTLYWNPSVVFDQNGKAKISFYAADQSVTYKVILEGITEEGEPLTSKMVFEVE